jgi:tetratricopeptide (TPR) repeat protein
MPTSRDQPAAAPYPRALLLSLALVAVTFLVYCRVLDHEFVNYDDQEYVVNNPSVRSGLTGASIRWALTSFEYSNWHPLTWLSLMLDRDFYGGLKPSGFHFTNVVLHLANTVLLLHVLRRMTGAVWRSALVAALFALHPLHVESVAWVTERKDVLSTLFWLLTLWAYAVYTGRPGPGRYALVVLALALGLATKPMLVTLPFVLLLLDYWPLGRWALRKGPPAGPGPVVPLRRLVVEKLPLLALTLASCLLTLHAQTEAVATREYMPLEVRLLNAVQAYGGYLRKTVWPVDLAAYYHHARGALPGVQVLVCGALLVAVTLGVWWARGRPYLAVGWFWFLGTLVPVIGLVQVGEQSMADRYTYVPLIGLFLAFAWGCGDLVEALGWRPLRVGLSVVLLAGLLVCAQRTWVQVGTWRNSRTLWEHAVRVLPGDYTAHDRLGMVHDAAGRPLEAWSEFSQAVELYPDSAQAQNNLGRTSLALGAPELARDHLTEAVRIRPDRPDVRYNLAMALVLCPERDLVAAQEHCRQALELNEDLAPAHVLLGYLCHERGQVEEGNRHYREALRLDPTWLGRAARESWRLATSQPPTPFNAALALLFARQTCQATGERRVDFLEARAAAEAAGGQYARAAQTLRQLLALVSEREDPQGYHAIQKRLELYERSKR